jgi:protein TonB
VSVKPVDLTTSTPQEETQEGIMLPQPLVGSQVYYPPLARRLGQSGRVEVAFTVAATGGVSDPQLLKSSGYLDLDMAALLTVTQWHFEPATQHGKAISARTKMILTFHLAG